MEQAGAPDGGRYPNSGIDMVEKVAGSVLMVFEETLEMVARRQLAEAPQSLWQMHTNTFCADMR